uniref:Glucosylceramidase n=1 Tax=Ditylenchus dipsaci TaxID=166011 RepID=A0A915D9A4_9BILA
MVGGGTLKGEFNGQYYETWAKYYISPAMQRDFVAKLLGPALKNSSLTANLKLMVNDDQRYWLPSHPDTMLQNDNASKYIDGIGVHWYADFLFNANRLTQTHNKHPQKFILATEACNGYIPLAQGPKLGDWHRGENYGEDIIEDLQNCLLTFLHNKFLTLRAVGWTDWNICLDEKGGPNFVGNFVDSPIIVNATSDEFYKQPMYYVLGHFSKFIRPESIRLGLEIKTHYKWFSPHLSGTAYSTPAKQIVLVLQNRHESHKYNVYVPSLTNTNKTLNFELEPNSIATVVWNHSSS